MENCSSVQLYLQVSCGKLWQREVIFGGKLWKNVAGGRFLLVGV